MAQNKKILVRNVPNTHVLDIAYQFHYIAENATGPRNTWDVLVATTVNASIALELYLKSFTATKVGEGDCIQFEGNDFYNYEYVETNVRSHKMSTIYNAIDSGVKTELENEYRAQGLTDFYSTLGEALSKFDHVFVGWRYIFENRTKGVEMKLLFALLNFFRSYTLRAPFHNT